MDFFQDAIMNEILCGSPLGRRWMHFGHMKVVSCIKLCTVLSEKPDLSPKIETKIAKFSVFPSIWRVCAYTKGSTSHTHYPQTKRQYQIEAETKRILHSHETRRVLRALGAAVPAGPVSAVGVELAFKVLRWLHFPHGTISIILFGCFLLLFILQRAI